MALFLDQELRPDFPHPGGVNQRLRPQVRAGLPWGGLGTVGRRQGAARGAHLEGQSPGRRDADLCPELLPAGCRGRRPVLHVHPLGRGGFTAVQQSSRDVAMYLAADYRQNGRAAWCPRMTSSRCSPSRLRLISACGEVFAVSRHLREHGWQFPAYTFPENRTGLAVLRVSVRRSTWSQARITGQRTASMPRSRPEGAATP